jgi:hypothetical protein
VLILWPVVAAIGRSSTRCVFFMPIGNPRCPPPQDID